jgi:glycosyltransferase involved in cell wall biosynthesis
MNDISGGAARAAFRLHQSLRRIGHDSTMLVQHQASRDPSVVYFAPPLALPSRLRRITRRSFLRLNHKLHYSSRPAGASFFSDDRSEHGADVLGQLPPIDILHLHWIAGFFDYRDFFEQLPASLPVVWTLHDMNPFTGGCHHARSCQKFLSGCGACPELGSVREKDLSSAIWSRKRLAYDHLKPGKFLFASPSRWLAGEARKSTLIGNFSINVIPNGVDTQSFTPRDRETSRDLLGVPPKAKVVLFVSAYLEDKYKGLPLLLEAIDRLRAIPDLFLLIIGQGQPLTGLSVPNKTLGFLGDEKLLSLVYSAADILALPSRADNFPNTALEALACGLPVVAFDVGGIPDMVRNDCTGTLVEPGNSRALAAAIGELLNDEGRRRQMSANCRRIAVEEYGMDVQARRYEDLYGSLLAHRVGADLGSGG